MSEPSERADRRRTFGPVALLGLASSALLAVAGNKPWAAIEASSVSTSPSGGFGSTLEASARGEVPLAAALGLVVLACWGVLLVTRGRFRRAVAGLAAVASLGALVTVVTGWFSVVSSLRDPFEALAAAPVEVHHTGWFWAAAVASVLALVASVLAVRWTPSWPEMGTKYDAPGTDGAPQPEAAKPEDRSSLDLWRAMDEGRDPTS